MKSNGDAASRDRRAARTGEEAPLLRHRARLQAIFVAACALLAACHPAPQAADGTLAGYNLIVINIDTLRADHLGCYGYGRDTSPFLDRLAAEGLRYERAYSASSFTRESVAALLTGRLPSSGGAVGWFAAPSPRAPTLCERMSAAGYRTGFLSNTTMLTDANFTRGCDTVEHLPKRIHLSGQGPRLSERALEFVHAVDGRPFALYLHYLDPHGDYEPSAQSYRHVAGGEPSPDPLHLYEDVRAQLGELVASGFGPGEARFEDLVARYDGEIFETDAAIAALFDGLEKAGLGDKTLIVVTADHGEEFLEHGFVEHAWTLYEESVHVPLILWARGHLRPLRVSERVSSVDVLPTVLDLLDVAYDPADFDGHTLLERGFGGLRTRAPEHAIVSELLIPERLMLRVVIDGDWKYLAAQRWLEPSERAQIARAEGSSQTWTQPDEHEIWGPIYHEELYDLAQDAAELHDRLLEGPLARLRGVYADYERRCREHGLPLVAPDDSAEPDPEREQRLKALGYL